jgi:hypothetical protein
MKKLLLIAPLVLTGACATLFSDDSDSITVKTEPSGAEVFINEVSKGRTPVTFDLKRDTFVDNQMRISKDGYESEKLRVNKTINGVAILNTTSLLSWGTDALTGKMVRYSPTAYYVELKRKGSGTAGHDALSSELIRYVNINFDKLKADVARGEGPFLNEYLKSLGVAPDARPAAQERIQGRARELIELSDPSVFHGRLSATAISG